MDHFDDVKDSKKEFQIVLRQILGVFLKGLKIDIF